MFYPKTSFLCGILVCVLENIVNVASDCSTVSQKQVNLPELVIKTVFQLVLVLVLVLALVLALILVLVFGIGIAPRSFSIAIRVFNAVRVSLRGGTLRLLLPGRIYGCSTCHLIVLIFPGTRVAITRFPQKVHDEFGRPVEKEEIPPLGVSALFASKRVAFSTTSRKIILTQTSHSSS